MKYAFPENFWWGSASSALQTGERKERGATTWDYWFAREPNRFHNGVGPQQTSTFYQHWEKTSAVKTAEPQQLSYLD
jgi:6-phospho-beta-glucosidase